MRLDNVKANDLINELTNAGLEISPDSQSSYFGFWQMMGYPRSTVGIPNESVIIKELNKWANSTGHDMKIVRIRNLRQYQTGADEHPEITVDYTVPVEEELYNRNKQDALDSEVLVQGYGRLTYRQLQKHVANKFKGLANIMDNGDAGNIKQAQSIMKNDPLLNMLDSLENAYDELSAMRKRGGRGSQGIGADFMGEQEIKEQDKSVSYDNWDHKEAVSYSKYLEKHFGSPDEMTNEQTVWHNIDGFKRVVCRDEYILHGSPKPHYDFVYSYIDLEVPEELSDELAKCSGSILIDHLKNEVGARCGSLTANAVTLNFCLDVVAGRAEPVKEEYERRIISMKEMFANGERYELDWWPDEAGDADPKNPYYKESINVEEQISKELQEQQNWFDYYNRFAKVSDPVKPTLKKYVGVRSPDGSRRQINPNSKDEVRRALDLYPDAMQQVGKNFGSYVDSPAWMANLAAQTPGGQQMMKDFGITQDELPAVLKMRDDFKAQYPQAFQKIKQGDVKGAWDMIKNEAHEGRTNTFTVTYNGTQVADDHDSVLDLLQDNGYDVDYEEREPELYDALQMLRDEGYEVNMNEMQETKMKGGTDFDTFMGYNKSRLTPPFPKRDIRGNRMLPKIIRIAPPLVGPGGGSGRSFPYSLDGKDYYYEDTDTPFNLAQFQANEAENRHTENAVALARKFGTKQEHENMLDIYQNHMERGYIEQDEQMARDDIIKKYYNNLQEDIDDALLRGNMGPKQDQLKLGDTVIVIKPLDIRSEEEIYSDLREAWSKKYKDSIDCSNPKGFSQKAHCAGRNKKGK